MSKKEEVFRSALQSALQGKKLPLLVLDHQWHKLFTQTGEHEKLHQLEEELNDLLRSQSRCNADIKSLSAYKKKLMNEIVSIMELPDSPEKERKMGDNKQMIEESNAKIDALKDELLELPRKMDATNMELMVATMEICYEKIAENTKDIESINQWIAEFRNQLKRKVLLKQKKEIWNDELYSYMHDIFGPDVIELFDMKYHPKTALNKEKDVIEQKEN